MINRDSKQRTIKVIRTTAKSYLTSTRKKLNNIRSDTCSAARYGNEFHPKIIGVVCTKLVLLIEVFQ